MHSTAREVIEQHVRWINVMQRRAVGTLDQRRHHLVRLDRWMQVRRNSDILGATGSDLVAWREEMDTAKLKPSSQSSRIAHVRSFYTWAAEEEITSARLLRYLIAPPVQPTLPRPIAHDDLDHAIACAVGRNARLFPWLLLGAYAGLRAMEVSELQAEDLNFGDVRPTIRVVGKGGKERIVPAGLALVEQLRQLDLPKYGYLFPAYDTAGYPLPGTRVSRGQVSHLGSTFLHETGSPSTFHALRHRFGTDLYAITEDLVLVARVMGHSNINTTTIYTAHNQRKAADAVDRIAELRLRGHRPPGVADAA